jgi:hypothetical protein
MKRWNIGVIELQGKRSFIGFIYNYKIIKWSDNVEENVTNFAEREREREREREFTIK